MEVKNGPKRPHMRDYWAKYRRRIYVIITSVQIVFLLATFGILEFAGIIHVGWVTFFVIVFVTAAILNAVTVTIIHIMGQPFRDLVQAVVLLAGEPSVNTPPNPNKPQYEKDGFRDILQTVYELSAAQSAQPSVIESPQNTHILQGLENTSTGIVILDADHNVAYNNPIAPVRIGTAGKPVLQLFFPEHDTLEMWLEKVDKKKLTAEHQWARIGDKLPGEKGRRLFDVSVSFHKDSPATAIITLFDRTTSYMPEEDDLDFISFAAHELRGPITVIRGYLDVLQDELKPVLQQDQAELMSRLIVTSNRLTSYINNILNAAQYDRRHLRLRLMEDNTRGIYDTIADDMQLRASAQNRILVVDIPDNLPTVAADRNAVGEVMGNLIDNAIKYSNEGGLVHVVARAIDGFVEVSIIDRGIGMPANIMPNLFHKFYRSHRSRETVSGTGIGLYICKAIVSSHGGTITARSVENEGSTFSFTLPIYDTVAVKLKADNNSNARLIEHGSGWIRNHSLYRG